MELTDMRAQGWLSVFSDTIWGSDPLAQLEYLDQ